jgi:hypothetical protein
VSGDPLIPVERIERDRVLLYCGARIAARKLRDYIRQAPVREFTEEGCTPGITPAVANAYQKIVGLMMVLGPRPGESRYIAPDQQSKPDATPEPQTLKEMEGEILEFRRYSGGDDAPRKRKRTKAG